MARRHDSSAFARRYAERHCHEVDDSAVLALSHVAHSFVEGVCQLSAIGSLTVVEQPTAVPAGDACDQRTPQLCDLGVVAASAQPSKLLRDGGDVVQPSAGLVTLNQH